MRIFALVMALFCLAMIFIPPVVSVVSAIDLLLAVWWLWQFHVLRGAGGGR